MEIVLPFRIIRNQLHWCCDILGDRIQLCVFHEASIAPNKNQDQDTWNRPNPQTNNSFGQNNNNNHTNHHISSKLNITNVATDIVFPPFEIIRYENVCDWVNISVPKHDGVCGWMRKVLNIILKCDLNEVSGKSGDSWMVLLYPSLQLLAKQRNARILHNIPQLAKSVIKRLRKYAFSSLPPNGVPDDLDDILLIVELCDVDCNDLGNGTVNSHIEKTYKMLDAMISKCKNPQEVMGLLLNNQNCSKMNEFPTVDKVTKKTCVSNAMWGAAVTCYTHLCRLHKISYMKHFKFKSSNIYHVSFKPKLVVSPFRKNKNCD